MKVRLQHTTITKGTYMDEEGDGYLFAAPQQTACENISVATRGYYQGSEEIIEVDCPDGCRLSQNNGGFTILVLPDGRYTDNPMVAAYEGVITIPGAESELKKWSRGLEGWMLKEMWNR